MNNIAKCVRKLDELEYFPVACRAEEILYKSIRKSLSQLGKTGEKAVIHYICTIYGLSENELLRNYDLFESAFNDVLGQAASKIIFSLIKKEILTQAVLNSSGQTIEAIQKPDLSIREMISLINYEDIKRHVRVLPLHSHSVCLYETTRFRDQVISTFFADDELTNTSKCYISEDRPSIEIQKEINHLTYRQISIEPSQMARNIFDMTKTSCSSANPPKGPIVLKIAEEDAGWWLRNGYKEKLQILEELLGRELGKNISIMCAFVVSKLNNKEMDLVMSNIIPHHNLVITEDPPAMYDPSTHTFFKNELKNDPVSE